MSEPSEDAPEAPEAEHEEELAPMDFSVLVLSLRASALMHLGQGKEEAGAQPPVDLPLASHSISVLSMLEEKTRGNLNGDEERLLSQALFELRVEYAAVSKQQVD